MSNFVWLLTAAILLQILDVLSFLLAYQRYGITGELNPIAVYLYSLGGLPMALAPKAAGVVVVTLALIWLHKRNESAAFMGALAMALAGIIGFLLNSVSFIL